MGRAVIFAALFLTLGASAYAGGGGEPPQQQYAVPQNKIVVVPVPETDNSNNNNWVVPVAVAALGTAGTIGAALIARKRRGS